jgi:ABC-2 type transport system ATP-binding protein
MSCLKVENLEKTFRGGLFEKDKHVLRSLSFSVPANKTTGFIGVNGAGKTTTIKCLFDFIRPDSGHIEFFGEKNLTAAVKRRIGYLPERPYYYEFLTAMEFLNFHWKLAEVGGGAGRDNFEKRAHEVLEEVGLIKAKDRRLRAFSKGMLQRIGMAQALLCRPEFLILDEPMSGLDPDGRVLIKDIIRDEQKNGTSIFFSSHLLNDMDELCDHLVVIDDGQLIFQGPLNEFAGAGGVEKSFRDLRKKLEVGGGRS